MKKSLFLMLFVLVIFTLGAQDLYELGIPIDNPDCSLLRSQQDNNLQMALNQKLKANKKYRQLIKAGKLSVGLVDLRNPDEPKFAHINGDQMMYAASLPKIAILLAAMDALDCGELVETAAIQKDMHLMISKSDNRASTRMINRLGYEKIEQVLTDPKYMLYDESCGGGLWVGKRYAAGGNRNPDPMQGLSHAATANQVCRFYYLMANGQLVSEERSKQMLNLMIDPKLHHKFVNTLDEIAPQAKVFRKSGSWQNFHSDSALIWGPERKYILVALAEDREGEKLMRNLVKEIDTVLKVNKPLTAAAK